MIAKELNLDGVVSELVENLKICGEGWEETDLILISDSLLDDFNNRKITPENINKILSLCDYLLIENTLDFVVKNSDPAKIYKLNEFHSLNYKLPMCMTGIKSDFHCEYNKDAVNYLIEVTQRKIYNAVSLGLTHYLDYYYPFSNIDNLCVVASAYGHLGVLKWLKDKGFELTISCCSAAAGGGHLSCLEYLHKSGCPWNESTCESAASGGHFECLRFAHENGCPWDEWTAHNAIRGGHIRCLKYIHELGGDIESELLLLETVIRSGKLSCLKYLFENCDNFNWNTLDLSFVFPYVLSKYDSCTEKDYLDCVQYAIDNGCVWASTLLKTYIDIKNTDEKFEADEEDDEIEYPIWEEIL